MVRMPRRTIVAVPRRQIRDRDRCGSRRTGRRRALRLRRRSACTSPGSSSLRRSSATRTSTSSASTDTTITLSSTPETRTPGRYGLLFSQDSGLPAVRRHRVEDERLGHPRAPRRDHGRSLARRARPVQRLVLPRRRESSTCRSRTSYLPTEVGFAPAWLVPAADDDWVIQVHGRGVTRSECIRAIPVFRDAGYTSLLVSYRNDGVAPDSRDRRYCPRRRASGATSTPRSTSRSTTAPGESCSWAGRWAGRPASGLDALGAPRSPVAASCSSRRSSTGATCSTFSPRSRRLPSPIRRGALELISSDWGTALHRAVGADRPRQPRPRRASRRAHACRPCCCTARRRLRARRRVARARRRATRHRDLRGVRPTLGTSSSGTTTSRAGPAAIATWLAALLE